MWRAKTGALTARGFALIALAGCQTYIPGTAQTLPTGRYLDYPPQYIPPSPPFPLARELATMEAQAGAPVPGAGALEHADDPARRRRLHGYGQ